jgi:ketosteroid isomerase-like protein
MTTTPTSATDYLTLGRRFLAIVSSQDWAGMSALLTEDVTWSFPGDARISGVAEGADAVIARATVITSSGAHIELLNVLAGVSGAAVSLHVTAHAGDGRTLDQHLVIVLSVRDGKVYKMDSYLSDPAKIVLYFGPPT